MTLLRNAGAYPLEPKPAQPRHYVHEVILGSKEPQPFITERQGLVRGILTSSHRQARVSPVGSVK